MRLLPVLLLVVAPALAQHPMPVPVPPIHLPRATNAEPTSPPARDIADPHAGLSFHLPPGWNFSGQDGDLATFALDARSAGPRARMHDVAALAFNPFPLSTFSGALFYVSSTPHSTPGACAAETATALPRKREEITLDHVVFQHGYSELGRECINARDEVYTALRQNSCLRFDLVINTFCGASSGARDMTEAQLANVQQRLQNILTSVRFKGSR